MYFAIESYGVNEENGSVSIYLCGVWCHMLGGGGGATEILGGSAPLSWIKPWLDIDAYTQSLTYNSYFVHT